MLPPGGSVENCLVWDSTREREEALEGGSENHDSTKPQTCGARVKHGWRTHLRSMLVWLIKAKAEYLLQISLDRYLVIKVKKETYPL